MVFQINKIGKAGEYMELLDREEMYSGLKIFLSKEIEEKNNKKKNLLDEREKLECEKNKKRKILFQTDESGERRKMFSPLNTIFYPSQSENFQDRKIKNLNYRIEDLEKQVGTIDIESDEIQKYLDALEEFMVKNQQLSDKEMEESLSEEVTKEREKLSISISSVLAETLENLQQFIQEQYENVEMLYDIEDNKKETEASVNEYIVEILQNLIDTSVNKMEADVFLVDIKNKEKLRVEVEILANKEKIDHCTFCMES